MVIASGTSVEQVVSDKIDLHSSDKDDLGFNGKAIKGGFPRVKDRY